MWHHRVPATTALLILIAASTSLSQVDKTKKKKDRIPEDVVAVLQGAKKMELLSLNPEFRKSEVKEYFREWQLLGSTTIESEDVRKQLVAGLLKADEENDDGSMMCFDPRHVLRVTDGKKSLDIVICFECLQARIYVTNNKDPKAYRHFLLSDSPQELFNKTLTEAKVPLPKQRGGKEPATK